MKAMLATFLVWACLTHLAHSQTQSGRGTLADSPSAKFTPQDFDMLWAAVAAVSRDNKKGAVKSWENTATGNGGSIKLLQSFTSTDGRECRRLRVDNHAKKQKGVSATNVCAGLDGKWLVDADAKPAPKPKP